MAVLKITGTGTMIIQGRLQTYGEKTTIGWKEKIELYKWMLFDPMQTCRLVTSNWGWLFKTYSLGVKFRDGLRQTVSLPT